VLFWGIVGAVVLRAAMIFGGAWLVHRFSWVFYIFGAYLMYTGIALFTQKEENMDPEHSRFIRWARRLLPVAAGDHGSHLTVVENGRRVVTRLGLVLIAVEGHGRHLCARLDPRDPRDHDRQLHRVHVEYLRDPRPALAVLRPREHDRALPAPQGGAGVRAGVHRRQNAPAFRVHAAQPGLARRHLGAVTVGVLSSLLLDKDAKDATRDGDADPVERS
jgi:tellurite resistance protein TerC